MLFARSPFFEGLLFYLLKRSMTMKKIIIAIIAFCLVFCACSNDLPQTIDYKKELTDAEIERVMKNANNDLAERPDENICYVTINCLKAIESGELSDAILSIVPGDGIILDSYLVEYEDGDTVFSVLTKAVREKSIHMEYSGTKKSPYIEGISNIYEFDCGSLSGWMYRINGWFPTFGLGQYKIKRGDQIELIYTCDLGRDIGEDNMY